MPRHERQLFREGAPWRRDRVAGSQTNTDAGFATVWTACAVAALLVITGVVLWLGGAIVARQRAAAAADLAALAAAGKAEFGVDRACAEAGRVAERMRVRITNCGFDGWDALVEVEMTLPGALAANGTVRARARAGPDDPFGEHDERSKGDRPTGRT